MRFIYTLLLALLCCACSDQAPTYVLSGRYDLVSVNGAALPYTVHQSPGTQQNPADSIRTLFSGAMDIGRDGVFHAVTCFSDDEPCYHPGFAFRNRIEHGTYTYVNGVVTLQTPYFADRRLHDTDGGETLIQHDGPDRLTGLTLVYRRRP